MSIDCSTLALPTPSKATTEQDKATTEQDEDTTEQHEHHFLDPSCRICIGLGRHRLGEGVVGRLGLRVGSVVTGIHGPGKRWQAGHTCVPGHFKKTLFKAWF